MADEHPATPPATAALSAAAELLREPRPPWNAPSISPEKEAAIDREIERLVRALPDDVVEQALKECR